MSESLSTDEVLRRAWEAAPSWTSEAERTHLMSLAREVKAGGLIVEVGGLYGGMTCVLGFSNPEARIVVVDNFSWSPVAERLASADELLRATREAGLTNVEVISGDSREIGRTWNEEIDLLWIDGGHSFDFVFSDLVNFGPWAKVVALHDWDNAAWPDIRQAVEEWLMSMAEGDWEIGEVVEMVVTLRKDEGEKMGNRMDKMSRIGLEGGEDEC